jgi:hypothetical protein
MKKLLLILICFIATSSFAQNLEFSLQLNSGLSKFRGAGTTDVSYVNENQPSANFTNNPYGTKQAIDYGLSADLKLVTKPGILLGLQAGYDILRSRVDLYQAQHAVYFTLNTAYFAYQVPVVGGYSIVSNQFINLNPYIGYRIKIKQCSVDLMPGMDMGIGTKSHENGQTTADDNTTVTTDRDLNKPLLDWRLRFDVKLNCDKFGLSLGYSRGISQYGSTQYYQLYQDSNNLPAPQAVYSNIIRIGLSYRLK